MIYDIQNFSLTLQTYRSPRTFHDLRLGKCKWLAKPLNWLIKKLNGYEMVEFESVSRVVISRNNTLQQFQSVVYDYQSRTGKRPEYVIVGHDNFYKLLIDERTKMMYPTLLDTKKVLGFKIILNPLINGIVPFNI